VFHIAHKGAAGGLFDRAAERGQIVAELAPQPGETVVEKGITPVAASYSGNGGLRSCHSVTRS
jgi:hypothetical protein